MLFVFLSTVFSLIVITNEEKPNFIYCSRRKQCETDCNCKANQNCELLMVNETIRNIIVYHHNKIRDLSCYSTPKPSGMTMLKYDMELEELSKCWVVKCSNKYSSCFRTEKFIETSQSVAQVLLEKKETPTSKLWIDMLSYWSNRAKTMSIETIKKLPKGREYEIIHNSAQIMSDKILSIGCAWSLLDHILTFVCTYGPRGPIENEALYKIGKPCTTCPHNYKCINKEPFRQLCKETYVDYSTTHNITQSTTKFTTERTKTTSKILKTTLLSTSSSPSTQYVRKTEISSIATRSSTISPSSTLVTKPKTDNVANPSSTNLPSSTLLTKPKIYNVTNESSTNLPSSTLVTKPKIEYVAYESSTNFPSSTLLTKPKIGYIANQSTTNSPSSTLLTKPKIDYVANQSTTNSPSSSPLLKTSKASSIVTQSTPRSTARSTPGSTPRSTSSTHPMTTSSITTQSSTQTTPSSPQFLKKTITYIINTKPLTSLLSTTQLPEKSKTEHKTTQSHTSTESLKNSETYPTTTGLLVKKITPPSTFHILLLTTDHITSPFTIKKLQTYSIVPRKPHTYPETTRHTTPMTTTTTTIKSTTLTLSSDIASNEIEEFIFSTEASDRKEILENTENWMSMKPQQLPSPPIYIATTIDFPVIDATTFVRTTTEDEYDQRKNDNEDESKDVTKSTSSIVIFFCVGIFFIFIGGGVFVLAMYILKLPTIT